jgi:hypothetical protein
MCLVGSISFSGSSRRNVIADDFNIPTLTRAPSQLLGSTLEPKRRSINTVQGMSVV